MCAYTYAYICITCLHIYIYKNAHTHTHTHTPGKRTILTKKNTQNEAADEGRRCIPQTTYTYHTRAQYAGRYTYIHTHTHTHTQNEAADEGRRGIPQTLPMEAGGALKELHRTLGPRQRTCSMPRMHTCRRQTDTRSCGEKCTHTTPGESPRDE